MDKEAEIVVLGYGGAGAVAAITAATGGANVLIIEKQPASSHYTSTGLSGANFVCPSDKKAFRTYTQALHAYSRDTSPLDNDLLDV